MTGRHGGISTIVISRQYTSVAKAFCNQTQKFVIFLPSDNEDLDVIFKKFLRKENRDTLKNIEKTLETTKYARLKIKRAIQHKYEIVVPHI